MGVVLVSFGRGEKNGSEFTNLPIAIAPGGGGASAVLDYESLELILSTFSLNYPSTGTSEEIYIGFM